METGIKLASHQEAPYALPERQERLMLLTSGRLSYAGLLGRPTTREFGAITIYVSFGNPFRIQAGNAPWRSTHAYVVQPDTPHRIASPDDLIGMLMVEPETVEPDGLPAFLQPDHGLEDFPDVYERLRSRLCVLMRGQADVNEIRACFDHYFFGLELPPRRVDPRIETVLDAVRRQPHGSFKAETLAAEVSLSVSRFLHLFKEEVGTTFRQYRAWKRVRGFLNYVNTPLNLTYIAMETGYPSSSHFSYTVRRYWGLTPKDIIAGSRQLAVVHDSGAHAYKGY